MIYLEKCVCFSENSWMKLSIWEKKWEQVVCCYVVMFFLYSIFLYLAFCCETRSRKYRLI